MIIIGVDYHPSFQQIAFMNKETGECEERRLNHSDGEAEKFYRDLKQRGFSARGDGGHRICTLVRAVTGGTGYRTMDWRCGGDQDQAGKETENGPRGRPTPAEVAAGRSLSSGMDTESGESRSATTTLASASAGWNVRHEDETRRRAVEVA